MNIYYCIYIEAMKNKCLIIPVRNRKQLTQNILEQIDHQLNQIGEKNCSVIVVDDGSTDGTPEMIHSRFPTVYLLQGDGSLWWTGAICLGMEYAFEKLLADYLVWLNDDISLSDDFLSQLSQVCDSPFSENAIIGGIVQDINYPDWVVYSGMVKKQFIRSMKFFQYEDVVEADTLNGNITVIPRTVVEQVGFPDPEKFRHYGGDFEYINRANKAGFKVLLSSKLKAIINHTTQEFIRYMPPWMQWHLFPSFAKRKEILQGFTNLKNHHNIWHTVNINNCDKDNKIFFWDYANFYVRQIMKILVSEFWNKQEIKQKINDFLKAENVPDAIKREILN